MMKLNTDRTNLLASMNSESQSVKNDQFTEDEFSIKMKKKQESKSWSKFNSYFMAKCLGTFSFLSLFLMLLVLISSILTLAINIVSKSNYLSGFFLV